jgi:SAM-dependent methyltransferase
LCPACGRSFDGFKDDWNRPNAVCWRCGAHERHRAISLLLLRRPELLAGARSLLHFTPEWALRHRLEQLHGLRYVTADLDQPIVDLRLDMTAIDLPEASFDAVLCSHVLEHIDDDMAAMSELRRVTAPRGWCLVMVPLDINRERTYEDPVDRLTQGPRARVLAGRPRAPLRARHQGPSRRGRLQRGARPPDRGVRRRHGNAMPAPGGGRHVALSAAWWNEHRSHTTDRVGHRPFNW